MSITEIPPDTQAAPSDGDGDGDGDGTVPFAGLLAIGDKRAFVRTDGYLPGPNDVYVSPAQLRANGLRNGDTIEGTARPPRSGRDSGRTSGRSSGPDSGRGSGRDSGRDTFNSLIHVDTVNGAAPRNDRPTFGALTPLHPQERLRLDDGTLATRVIDLLSPIGKGQRGLIISPPKVGKTMVLRALAQAIATNHPECHLMVVLVDERPEEVTDMQRSLGGAIGGRHEGGRRRGEVIHSTFDHPADDHITVAELAVERAKRLVEQGHDVVMLLDSITRLGRAYNLAAPAASSRILAGGVAASALYPPKKFFGAARNIEHGGSLTILATALVETGSRMDDVFFEEFKGTGNMELRLDRSLADKRIFPAVDADASGTRRDELLMGEEELRLTWRLRRTLQALDRQQAIELLLDKLKTTSSNAEFLLEVRRTT
jgi:transcription termination factor Rho